jgi:hypothetical protein
MILANVDRINSGVQVWHGEGQIHVKINLRWTVIKRQNGVADACSVRIGLDTPLVYFPAEFMEEVQHAIILAYRKLQWAVDMNDDFALFSHPED